MALEQKFGRFVRLTVTPDDNDFAVDDRVVTELKMVFQVRRFIGDSVHTMTIDIYNLYNGEAVSVPFGAGRAIQLEAGYQKVKGTIFRGIISNVNTFRQDSDLITRVYCRDSNRLVDPTITVSYTASTNLNDLLNDIASKAGLSIARQSIRFRNTNKAGAYNKPFSVIMKELGASFDFRHFIFNGDLYLFDTGQGNIGGLRHEIDASTGLLETPVLTTLGINLKTLMEPKLKPSDRFIVRSGGLELVQGGLEFNRKLTNALGDQQVLSLVHTGDTHGDAWYTEIIGAVLKDEQLQADSLDG